MLLFHLILHQVKLILCPASSYLQHQHSSPGYQLSSWTTHSTHLPSPRHVGSSEKQCLHKPFSTPEPMWLSQNANQIVISLLKFFKDVPSFPENQVHKPRPYSGSLHLPPSISLNSFCCLKPLHLLFPLPTGCSSPLQFLSLILGTGLQRFLCVALIWQLWYLHCEPCTMILALWASLESRLWFNLYCDCRIVVACISVVTITPAPDGL